LVVFGADDVAAEGELLTFLSKIGVSRLVIKPGLEEEGRFDQTGGALLSTAPDLAAVASAVLDIISRSRSDLATSVRPWSERPFPVPM
jgi:hypothetical protein